MSTLVSNPRSRPHADNARASGWAELGACVGRFQEFHASEAAARAMCRACPVTLQCLNDALQEEGTAAPSYRSEIRGGLDPHERAALSGYVRPKATGGRIGGDMGEVERLLRLGTMTDHEISAATGVGRHTIGTRRRSLGLPSPVDLRGATPQERLDQRTHPDRDGHLLWLGSENTHVGGRTVKGIRLAFEVGHGRPPEGRVKRICDASRCVAWQHLADRPMRDALAAAHTVPAEVQQ